MKTLRRLQLGERQESVYRHSRAGGNPVPLDSRLRGKKVLWQVCVKNSRRSSSASFSADIASFRDKSTDVSHLPTRLTAEARFRKLRHRDLPLRITTTDTDQLVHTVLIPFLAGYLDQGQTRWTYLKRQTGLLRSFARLHARRGLSEELWTQGLRESLSDLAGRQWNAVASIEASLIGLGVSREDQFEYLASTMLALPGWTGIARYLELDAEWMSSPVPSGTMHVLLALRLILDRLAAEFVASRLPGFNSRNSLSELSAYVAAFETTEVSSTSDPSSVVATIFQLAQTQGWLPSSLSRMTVEEWRDLECEVTAFSCDERLRCIQKSIELSFRDSLLDALSIHSETGVTDHSAGTRKLQVVCCTDPCGESLRRHLEESCPDCDTYGTPGFFGLGLNFRALGETHFSPQCPVNVKANHYVEELPGLNSDGRSQRNPRDRVKQPGKSPSRTLELSSLLENWLSTPQLTRLLFPGIARRMGVFSVSNWQAPRSEQLHWQATENGLRGYCLDEMVDAVSCLLRQIGLVENFAPVVLLIGHVSISTNNPFAAAHNCSLCSGRRGRANAR